jgi:hypothetical protein
MNDIENVAQRVYLDDMVYGQVLWCGLNQHHYSKNKTYD